MAKYAPKMQNYGFLTDLKREYLITGKDKNLDEDTENKQKQYDFHIERHARQALKDLILVARSSPPKKNKKIFTIGLMRLLLSAVVAQQRREITEDGIYFQVLIKEIEKTVNEDTAYPAQIRCDVVEYPGSPFAIREPDWNDMDIDDRRHWFNAIQKFVR